MPNSGHATHSRSIVWLSNRAVTGGIIANTRPAVNMATLKLVRNLTNFKPRNIWMEFAGSPL